MDVVTRSASPTLAAASHFKFHDSLCAQTHTHSSIEALCSGGHEDTSAFSQGSLHFRPTDDLCKMRRADFLFSFCHQHQIHRQLPPRSADGMQGCENGRLRTFLVHGAAPDDDTSKAWLID